MTKRIFTALFLLILFSSLTIAQKPKRKSYAPKKPSAAVSKKESADEKETLEKALAETDLTQKIAALQQFIKDFPKSAEKIRAQEVLVSSRAQLADEKLRLGEKDQGIKLFKQAVAEAPDPISDKLFAEVISQFPTNLFFRGERAAAIEVANLIEEKTAADARQLLGLATFYLGTENAAEASRIAEKAIALEPTLPAAYQTLGLANRLAFQLDDSEAAYAKALELDTNSAISKRSLAEMKRATGKPDEAVALYRELLEKDPADVSAQTGLTLSLFDSEKQPEAEAQLAKTLEANPNNLVLLVGASYWYAAHQNGDKAVELARQAVTLEPRYTWARIALARGFMTRNNPLEAERELLAARQYGNFPTLDYEIAAARLNAGLYEEAAQELSKNFIVKDDLIETKLGNRIEKQSSSFIQLLELERRAGIFEPLAADDPITAGKLKSLLLLNQILSSKDSSGEAITQAVKEFVKGDNKAKIYRQLYAANKLLQAKRNLPEAMELTKSAINGVDTALEVPNAAAAVMADELYESRRLAISRNEVIVIPQIPPQTLSSILRGRIEEISGWTLYQQNKPGEAVVRLKRAVSILPEKSAWWRSSTWKLGAALDAAGKQPEALNIYIKSYLSAAPDVVRRSVIESLYKKVNGSLEGLDAKIGAKPTEPTIALDNIGVSASSNETVAQNTEKTTPETAPTPTAETTPEASPGVSASPENSPVPQVEIMPSPSPQTNSSPIPESSPEVKNTPEVKIEETAVPEVEASPSPAAEKTPEEIKPTPNATPEIKIEKTPTPSPSPETKVETSENKTSETSIPAEIKAEPTPKLLFEPVIISVPKPEILKSQKPASVDEKSSEVAKNIETDDDNSGEVRPRLSMASKPPEESQTLISTCQLTISQDSLSILNNGGSLGILLGYQGEGGGDITKVTPLPGSPDDISVTLEPDIGKLSNRAFFIIKSISANTGAFTVTFDSPCGKKEVLVKVR